MSSLEAERVRKEFERLGLKPIYLDHEPALTSEDAARIRGGELRQGIKALVLAAGDGRFFVIDIPADKKADMRKIADTIGLNRKSLRMATPEEVLEVTGCEIGGVPPFGHKTALPLYVDEGIFSNEESAFNIGLRTRSVKIPTVDMRKVFESLKARFGSYSKE